MTNRFESRQPVVGEAQAGSTEYRIILDKKHRLPRETAYAHYSGSLLHFISGKNGGAIRKIVSSLEKEVLVTQAFYSPVQPGDKYTIIKPITEVTPLEIPSEEDLSEDLDQLEETLKKACEILKAYRERVKDI